MAVVGCGAGGGLAAMASPAATVSMALAWALSRRMASTWRHWTYSGVPASHPIFDNRRRTGWRARLARAWRRRKEKPVDWLPALLMMGGALIVVSLLIAWLMGRWLR